MATKRAQALIELAIGMFAISLVVGALCVFAVYIARSLNVQNQLRTGGKHTDSVEVDEWTSANVFGVKTLKINEKLEMPSTAILK